MSETPVTTNVKLIATVACDLEFSPIKTRSRLADQFGNIPVLRRTLALLRSIKTIDTIILLAPAGQEERIAQLANISADTPNLVIRTLQPRPAALSHRVALGRAWDLSSWRGGAGQYTVFDEDYHPAAVAGVIKEFNAAHVLTVAAHAALLDPQLFDAVIHHHRHKNHEMRVTYMPAAPGLAAMVLRADIALEMAPINALPMHLLAYEPSAPILDTMVRDACMQIDPALSKIPNRFLLDTERSWHTAEKLLPRMPFTSSAALALAARDLETAEPFSAPRELEIELTGQRSTAPLGSVPALTRLARGTLDPTHWTHFLARQNFPDDLLLTFAGDGDPLFYPHLLDILHAARAAGLHNIHLQTDLLEDPAPLLTAIEQKLIDIISITTYGLSAVTHAAVANVPPELAGPQLLAQQKNLGALIEKVNTTGTGGPLLIPRLLKCRQTIPDMEPFFDHWIQRCGWAVLDSPTDRAGNLPFAAVVDMAPPKRRPCRRLWNRLLLRANGTAVACDQDMHDTLALGHIESLTLPQLFRSPAADTLRQHHLAFTLPPICQTCREWHRP